MPLLYRLYFVEVSACGRMLTKPPCGLALKALNKL